MPGNHRRPAGPRRRRRAEEEGEDEDSHLAEAVDDSQSEGSIPSDVDADAEADDSDLSETDGPGSLGADEGTGKANGAVNPEPAGQQQSAPPESSQTAADTSFPALKDTEAMLNGLKISDEGLRDDALDFDALRPEGSPAQVAVNTDAQTESRRQDAAGDRRRREHDDYRRRRDADPAFIPTRGNFFMHDQRTGPANQNGYRIYSRGSSAGRGRNPIGGPFSPAA